MSRRSPQKTVPASGPRRHRWLWVAVAVAISLAGVASVAWWVTRPSLRQVAETAEKAGDWTKALDAYQRLTTSNQARARDWVGLARTLLGLNRAREAELALSKARALDPAEVEGWHLLLELLRVERRGLEAENLGWQALASVTAEGRKTVLRDLTLSLLFLDTPLDARAEQRARDTLERWIASDPEDDEARAALALRMAADPNPDDPDRASRVTELSRRLEANPDHVGLREALIVSLADAGEIDEGRTRLDAWPAEHRDERYARLRARWDLEYDRRPSEAVAQLIRVLTRFPHEWRSHYHLSRALKVLGREAEAKAEAETVKLLRERLEPNSLANRLARNLSHLDDPSALRDLADLCKSVGLNRLAQAWTNLAASPRPAH